MNTSKNLVDKYFRKAVTIIEKFLALIILTAVIVYVVKMTFTASISDVDSVDFIQKLISDILLMLLGLEVVRLLIVPSVQAATELLIFVVARKTLSPNISSQELFLDIIAFAILLLINSTCINGSLAKRVSGIVKKNN